ncbi:MAG: enolase C-terminal domain-like protein, partial [Planctomycetota bacterium]
AEAKEPLLRKVAVGFVLRCLRGGAVDLALWDLAGKRLGEPVHRLLGGPTCERVPAYASTLGHDVTPDAAATQAAQYKADGYLAQKWFFRFGPRHGQDGIAKNLTMAAAVRAAVGEHYPIMFDAFMGWDVPYAIEMCRALEPLSPRWVEEPLLPEDVSGYATLKSSTRVPIAFGEHVYGRRQVQPLLQRGVMDVVQTDPDWTGGLTELVAICHLAAAHGKTVAPHGHTILPALHAAATQPPSVVPMVEYLVLLQPQKQAALTSKSEVVDGFIAIPDSPGLGIDLVDADWSVWTAA